MDASVDEFDKHREHPRDPPACEDDHAWRRAWTYGMDASVDEFDEHREHPRDTPACEDDREWMRA